MNFMGFPLFTYHYSLYTVLMISKYTYKKMTWVDIESPTREEVRTICEEYDLPELVGDELLEPTYRSKVDQYDKVIYLILHFPTMDPKAESFEQEVDFVIGKDFIITTRYEKIDPLNEFSKLFNPGSSLDRGAMGSHAGYLFYFMTREIYHHISASLEPFTMKFTEIEKNVFAGNGEKMVLEISNVHRALLDVRQSIRFHSDILQSFEEASIRFFGEEFQFYANSIIAEYNKVDHILDGHHEIIHELRETNDSLITTKTNETIKTLTILSFIILPLSLIAGIFGMNAKMPIVDMPNGFWMILFLMGIAACIMFLFFKHKKWF